MAPLWRRSREPIDGDPEIGFVEEFVGSPDDIRAFLEAQELASFSGKVEQRHFERTTLLDGVVRVHAVGKELRITSGGAGRFKILVLPREVGPDFIAWVKGDQLRWAATRANTSGGWLQVLLVEDGLLVGSETIAEAEPAPHADSWPLGFSLDHELGRDVLHPPHPGLPPGVRFHPHFLALLDQRSNLIGGPWLEHVAGKPCIVALHDQDLSENLTYQALFAVDEAALADRLSAFGRTDLLPLNRLVGNRFPWPSDGIFFFNDVQVRCQGDRVRLARFSEQGVFTFSTLARSPGGVDGESWTSWQRLLDRLGEWEPQLPDAPRIIEARDGGVYVDGELIESDVRDFLLTSVFLPEPDAPTVAVVDQMDLTAEMEIDGSPVRFNTKAIDYLRSENRFGQNLLAQRGSDGKTICLVAETPFAEREGIEFRIGVHALPSLGG